ncbi:MAG: ABC transporter permease [Spirochaetota bacterium]
MAKYIFKRIVFGVLSLWVVITITFLLMHSIPGGPFDQDAIEKMNANVRKNLEAKFGLDRPLAEQYFLYLGNLFRGELGISIQYSPRTVNQIVSIRMPASAKVGGLAMIIALAGGVGLGVLAALKHEKWQDQTVKILSTIGIAVPGFVLATLLIYVFAVRLGWFRTFGFRDIRDMILPAIALAGGSIAFLSRLTRSSMLNVIRQDYVRTAKAKGLSRTAVVYKHAFKNALLPIITYVGPMVAAMLTGSFVIEKIFVVPGLGGEMVKAIGNRDYMMILGLTSIYAGLLVTVFIIVDIVYALVDPRVKYE